MHVSCWIQCVQLLWKHIFQPHEVTESLVQTFRDTDTSRTTWAIFSLALNMKQSLHRYWCSALLGTAIALKTIATIAASVSLFQCFFHGSAKAYKGWSKWQKTNFLGCPVFCLVMLLDPGPCRKDRAWSTSNLALLAFDFLEWCEPLLPRCISLLIDPRQEATV